MKQSPNDKKSYRAITLTNGLRTLLIENNDSEKAAVALAVNAGHFNDPAERQGLAHFVEHMLFLGTDNYPNGGDFQKFITNHGGHNNAWTGTQHTSYFFDIHHSQLEPALTQFSRFFIAPLLDESFVQSERQNIDAEFKLKLKDDIRRLYDVHKETINQAHPFSQFSVGNIETLADNEHGQVHRDIVKFFDQFYSANLMTLAIEGPYSLDELTRMAESYFAEIANHKKPLSEVSQPLYQPEHLAQRIKVTPVKNDRQLIISFAMPCLDHYYTHKPESVLAYLIGHEGTGSILSYLKSQHWAMSLTAGAGVSGSNFKDFNISIRLTELGEQHSEEIIEAVFSYINLLTSQTIPDIYYKEKQSLASLAFEYQEKLKPLESVSQLVLNMQHYPIEHYIYGDYIMEGMCTESVALLLSYLSATNCRILHVGQSFTTNKESKWYKVPYSIESIATNTLEKWSSMPCLPPLHLPAQNPYITSSPEVFGHDVATQVPTACHSSDGLNIWYKQDTTFKVPKGYIYIGIDSPYAIASAQNVAMTKLFVDLYFDSVIEKYYDAELAGIHYHLYAHQGGITLQLSGISSKQPILLAQLLTDLQNFSIAPERFLLLKEQLLNYWHNSNQAKSIAQLFSALSSFMQPNNPSSAELAHALDSITYEQFESFATHLFDDIAIEALIHGNWKAEHAQQITDLLEKTFIGKFDKQNKVVCPVIDLADKPELLLPLHLPNQDHAVVVYYPHTSKDLKSAALIMLISHLLSPLFFEEMRTEKQYGYLVNVGYIPINNYPGLAFYIQSPNVAPDKLLSEINNFIAHWHTKANKVPNEQWQALKQGLIGQLQEHDTSLRIKSQRFWNSICNDDTDFNHKQKMIEAIEQAEISDLEAFISVHQNNQSKYQYQNRVTLLTSKVDNELFVQNNTNAGEIIINRQAYTAESKHKH